MPVTDSFLTLGSPRFSDARLTSLAASQGSLAAWRDAVSGDAKNASVGVSGDFALALRDSNGRTFLAVDRFAIPSLCYRVTDGQLQFAARADELANAQTAIDPQAIFDYLYFHVIPSPRTIYKGIFRLPPGHYALFENGQLAVAPYWVPTFDEQSNVSFDSLKAEFRQLMRDAVATQRLPFEAYSQGNAS